MNVQSFRVNILGVKVDDLSKEDLLDLILGTVNENKRAIISYVNVHALNLAYRNSWFRDYLNSSDVVFCDGFGVKYAASFLYHRKIDRFTPPDWLPDLFGRCVEHDFSLFFLGSKPNMVEKAAQKLAMKVPGFQPIGTHHGYFDKNRLSLENQDLIREINLAKPDILLVGFGMPVQEKWILENWNELDVKVVLPVGAAFDYLAEEVYRVPPWMTDHGFEWLGRLVIEPGRLWKRYILGNPLFFWRVFLQKIGIIKGKEVS